MQWEKKAFVDDDDAAVEREIKLGRLGRFIGFRLRRVQNQLSRAFAEATADRGMRSGLFSSLAIIQANPGISQNELSRTVGLDKSVTVQLIDDLERRGFAARKRSESDRRRHALTILPAGEAFLNELFETMETTEKVAMRSLTAEELKTLSALLDRMYDACVADGEDR